MQLRSLMALSSLLFLTSCAGFHTGRTYLSEMEHDDSRFFQPETDFPVVGGDSGRYHHTEAETRDRTPASTHDIAEDNRRRALKQELRELEDTQSDGALEFYEEHKHQLATVSEKIYFLKLPPHERKEYMQTRGFLPEPKTPDYTKNERMFAVRQQDILLGMTKDDVMESWGQPVRVEIAGNPRFENERWVYNVNGDSKFIYFEAGEVQGWE